MQRTGSVHSVALQSAVLPDPKLAMAPENIRPLLENVKEVHLRLGKRIHEIRYLIEKNTIDPNSVRYPSWVFFQLYLISFPHSHYYSILTACITRHSQPRFPIFSVHIAFENRVASYLIHLHILLPQVWFIESGARRRRRVWHDPWYQMQPLEIVIFACWQCCTALRTQV